MSSHPAIKLFGKRITLPLPTEGGGCDGDDNKIFPNKEIATSSEMITKEKEGDTSPDSDEKDDYPVTPRVDETAKKHCSDDQVTAAAEKDTNNTEENQTLNDSSGNGQDKSPLKKPDKILPCPRCNSVDTKFCYYNNYNVNQPRHFCKKCQRYWTAGGIMRNVPVGAGRRKNKNAAAAALYRHLIIRDSAALQAMALDSIHHPSLNPNGTVLSFGSDSPPCGRMASILNLAEKTMKNCNRNGFHGVDEQMEEQSPDSSASALNSRDEGNGANLHQNPPIRNCQGFVHHVPYLNGASLPWPYPCNPQPPVSPTGAAPFCSSSFPIPIYPAAATTYWGCSTWSIPWIVPLASTSPTSGSGSNSPTLGKHSREGGVLLSGENLWIPKTLRIDDPEDATKSSIWATMGFNSDDQAAGISSRKGGGGFFKSFQNSKTEHDSRRVEANSQVLHANPAAMSRSINFSESS